MKRTFDNSVFGGQNTSGQISTGMMPTKDIVYYNTNMVNVQAIDTSTALGIECSFNQTRVLPIVGRTNRAEIAIKTVDVQTKALPMFQPQVLVGQNDINKLIYQVGLSATWRNGLISLPPDGSVIDTLFQNPVQLPDPLASYYGESTFLNSQGAFVSCSDSFNDTFDLTLLPSSVTHTALSVLFDYWQRKIFLTTPSKLFTTCLTPLVIPSVRQKIIRTSYVLTGNNVGKMIVEMSSNANFNKGDRVRFFGLVDDVFPLPQVRNVFATVLDKATADDQNSANLTANYPSVVLDYDWDTLSSVGFVPSVVVAPVYVLRFTVDDTTLVNVGQFILVKENVNTVLDSRVKNQFLQVVAKTSTIIECIITLTGTLPTSVATTLDLTRTFSTGYIINQTVLNGGHIEFLTDEAEFQPLSFIGTSQAESGTLILQCTAPTRLRQIGSGFFRGCTENGSTLTEEYPMNSAVKIVCTNLAAGTIDNVGGYYRIVKRSQVDIGVAVDLFELIPISRALIPGYTTGLQSKNFRMQLAPNFYALDTSATPVITSDSKPRYNFMRSVGFPPTQNIILSPPTYPPTATIPSNTWTRAYTVSWDFSAYRNLRWNPQNTTSATPSPPLLQQDFGNESSSSYYNCYEWNKFIGDSVNKGVQLCINDKFSDFENLESYSLNRQLSTVFTNYVKLFQDPIANFVYSATTVYQLGQIAISGTLNSSLVFASKLQHVGKPLPSTEESSTFWLFLGSVPYTTAVQNPQYALLVQHSINPFSNCTFVSASLNISDEVPGRVYTDLLLSFKPNATSFPVSNTKVLNFIPTPFFQTLAPEFYYDELTLLSYARFDGTGFGTVNTSQDLPQSTTALYNYKRRSWGHSGEQDADELMIFESNSSFKFLLDNFPSYCIAYEDTESQIRIGDNLPLIDYWIWDNSSLIDPRVGTGFYNISQSSESLSSCMSPVQSIVVVSENIPVYDELASPAFFLIDSSSPSFTNNATTVALTEKVIGEVFLQSTAPYNSRSVVHFREDELKFVSMLDTRSFKQLEYSLYYRHRITQQLVPLILTNYGSVNIKFVFRPIS